MAPPNPPYRARKFSSLWVIASSIALISCFTVSPSSGVPGSAAAHASSSRPSSFPVVPLDDQNSSVRLAEKECLVVGNFEHRVPHDGEGLQFAGRNRHVRLTKRLVDLKKRFMQDRSDFLPVSYVIGHKYRLLSFTKLTTVQHGPALLRPTGSGSYQTVLPPAQPGGAPRG